MKHPFFLVAILLTCMSLVACIQGSSVKETKNWDPTPYDTLNNFEGVSMTVKKGSVSQTELIVVFENSSNKQAIYGDYFSLEKKLDGDWYQVPTIIDEYGFDDIGYELGPSEPSELKVDWEWLYGKLGAGEYRIIKDVSDFRSPGDFDEYYVAASFTID